MDKIVYIYGSARDASTRALRRGALPRESRTRVGPWLIRPSRRTAVDFVQLAKYEREVLEKCRIGRIQIQNGDTEVFSIEVLQQAFAELRSEPGAESPMTMPYAELMELMRSESPSQEVWDAFVERSLTEVSEPDLATRISGLTEYAKKNSANLEMATALRLLNEARLRDENEKRNAEAAARAAAAEAAQLEEEARLAAEAEKAEADAKAAAEAAEKDQNKVPTDAPPPPAEDDKEQMDFSKPEETVAPPQEEEKAAPEESSKEGSKEALLPEGWRTFTNAKLVELLTELGVELPERQNKASLTGAVEAWLGGN